MRSAGYKESPSEPIAPAVRPPRFKTAAGSLLAFTFFLGLAVGLQRLSGAYHCELSGYPDEPAHFITSLMVRDYIAAGFPAHPVQYAENYYLHYPKVAFGMWGPLFHTLGGLWLLLSPGRESMLLLMALIVAAFATVLYAILRREFSVEAGLAGGVLLIAAPAAQASTAMIMGDHLCSLFDLLSCIFFARYLQTGKAREAIWFGLLASLSILAKPSGLALALLPPLGVLLTGRTSLFKTRAFWYPAVIVAVLCGPWQFLELRLLSDMHRETHLSWSIVLLRLTMQMMGPVLFAAAIFGIFVKFIPPFRREPANMLWPSAGIMALAVWGYHFLLPVGVTDPRYMFPVLPVMLMFLMAALHWIAARLPGNSIPVRWKSAGLIVVALLIFSTQTYAVYHKPQRAFQEVADALMARPDLADAVFLVSSEADGEGLFISEVALRESRRPAHITLRAGKVIGQSDWTHQRYNLLYTDPSEILKYLESIPVRIIIIERSPSWFASEHQRLLCKTLEAHPNRFALLGTYPQKTRGAIAGARIDVYEMRGRPDTPPGKIRIEMPFTWGKPIEN